MGGALRAVSLQAEFARIAREEGRAALVTVVSVQHDGVATSSADESGPAAHGASASAGAKLLVRADGRHEGALGDSALDHAAIRHAEELMWAERSELRVHEGVGLFVDVTHPPPRLIVFGAVDFGAALCRLARHTGWRPYVVDPRARFATAERFPEAEEVVAAWPDEAFARLGGIDRATYVAVLTHDPKLDDAALIAALRSDAPYVGAMGSRRANASRRERLLAAGLSEEEIDRIAAPIGLDLGGTGAAEMALSIMSEVVAVRNGHEGGRLKHSSGRIHEVGA